MIAATIPVKNESCIFPTGNAPFPTEVIPFPIEVVSFPTEDAPFPTEVVPFPTGDAPFPTGDIPFPTGNASFPIGNVLFPIGNTTFFCVKLMGFACSVIVLIQYRCLCIKCLLLIMYKYGYTKSNNMFHIEKLYRS